MTDNGLPISLEGATWTPTARERVLIAQLKRLRTLKGSATPSRVWIVWGIHIHEASYIISVHATESGAAAKEQRLKRDGKKAHGWDVITTEALDVSD